MVHIRFFVILLLVWGYSVSLCAVEDFEDLDWELRYPEVIFQEREASLSVSFGVFTEIVEEELLGGVYLHLIPEMKFLMFEGSFHIGLRTVIRDQEMYIDFENLHPSQYFQQARFRYKELQFLFGQAVPTYQNQFYGPYRYLGEAFSAFEWDWNAWEVQAASLSWNNWAIGTNTPEWSWGNGGISGSIDTYIDWSASETFALSIGPSVRFDSITLTPMIAFATPDLFGAGAKVGLTLDQFSFHTGIQWLDGPMHFINIQLGPVGFSSGEKPFFRGGQMDRESWKQISLDWNDDIYAVKLGFGNRILFQEETVLQNDLFFRLQNTWNMSPQWQIRTDIRLMPRPTFSIGIAYRFQLET